MVVQTTRGNPDGPRFLTQRNLERRIRGISGDNGSTLPKGFMQLFSYYKPSLTAGNYCIIAEQFISSRKGQQNEQSLRICNRKGTASLSKDLPSEKQIFEVMAPQFSLDPKLVNSFYPPEGHQDEGRILPHIVINDPHFPWERDADSEFGGGNDNPLDKARLRDPDLDADGRTLDGRGNPTEDREEMNYRSMIPWVRLLVFDVEELKLDSAQQARDLGVPDFADLNAPKADIKRQPASGAFSMLAKDYFAIQENHRLPIYQSDPAGLEEVKTGRRSKETTQVIYPKKDLFYKLCKDVESNKYLAHVRNVNTIGCPDAGLEEEGLFSIVISGRTGAFKNATPTTQVVHLISLESMHSSIKAHGWDASGGPSSAQKEERIGLISLFSWTYTALPPNPVNFIDTMMAIVGNENGLTSADQVPPLRSQPGNRQMLRPDDGLIISLENERDAAKQARSKLLASRLRHGYTISRWRCETGEFTAAFTRGPLVPVKPASSPSPDWPTGSNTSKNYQILDKTTGLMDLSYSSAWTFGKTLAISDTSFSAALLRFRSQVHNGAASIARAQFNGLLSRSDALKKVLDGVMSIRSRLGDHVVPPRRVVPVGDRRLTTALDNVQLAVAMSKAVLSEVTIASKAGDEVFNEFNVSGENNTDWAIILKWITDRLYLNNIPAHILFPDPTFIPEESIRFFYIDDTWMDCLIDGALSVGNHVEKDDDMVKTAIKQLYNVYLSTTVPNTSIKPQIPHYGFVLRSQIVKVMPDLRITVNWNTIDDSDQRAPVCQWIRPDDHTLLCLLDRPPEELAKFDSAHPDRSGIVLSQPPHQQRFSFGHAYDPDDNKFEFRVRHLYTTKDDVPSGEWKVLQSLESGLEAAKQIDGDTRVLKVGELAKIINNGIQQQPGTDLENPRSGYMDFVPNSAELALELNDPAYYFIIYPKADAQSMNKLQRIRKIWAAPVPPRVPEPQPTQPPSTSDPIGPPIQPPLADGPTPIIPVRADVPGEAGKVIVVDHPVMPVDRDSGNVPVNMMPKKCFTMDVFVDYRGLRLRENGAYDRGDYIPTQSKYLVDLIFSIRKGINRTDPRNDQLLREVVVHIPNTPDPNEATKTDALITKDWKGRARLLSNQRFVTFVSRTPKYLEIRLIPRSAEINPVMKVNDNKTREISIVLTEVNVPRTAVKKFFTIKGERQNLEFGFARIDMWERYQLDPSGLQVVSITDPRKYFVIKKEVEE
ncbi:hypothetical protein IFR04_012818 [Cadophora malorum]|uniref:Uncharacterized protein n=1 Tax=Cadophora malorum TaxID=108018 RepID=A0A8H7W3Q5_9HELO|nr:hypothetical protein IFR04_012818 [Cadophora malorum]